MQTLPAPSNGILRRSSDQQMEHRRYWTDEEEQDAIYNVYLKKIRYAQGSECHVPSEDPTGVAYQNYQTVKIRLLKAGTMDKVIDSLVNSEHELDSSHVNIFLDTFREFTKTGVVVEHLLKHLVASYGSLSERPLKQLISILLENYPDDFPLVEFDESIISLREHADKYGDIDLKNRLKQWIAKAEDRSLLPNPEVLDWIRDTNFDSPAPAAEPLPDYPTAEDLLNFSDKLIADQLTLVDAELLKRLLPHECLAQERARNCSKKLLDSVQATICHFNAVCTRVQASLLGDATMTPSLRLRLLIKWIDIAQFLLVRKNFSSLNAVVSALQAEPVFRLEKLWSSLPTEKLRCFEELKAVSADRASGRNELQPGVTPATQSYGTLTREPAAFKSAAKKSGHRRSYSDNPGIVQHGTVPYLGKFLTDLVMLDTALPDHVTSQNGQRLINFDKRRKEFEILAQIRLFQSAAMTYQIERHDHFRFWFYKTLRVLGSEECFANSFLIEPPTVSRSTSEVSSDCSEPGTRKGPRSALLTGLSTLRRIVSQENLIGGTTFVVTRKNSISSSQSLDYRRANGSTPEKSPYLSETFCILKISLDENGGSSVFYSGVNLYKSILVNDCEKTVAVIRSALEKHGRDSDDPAGYDLVQVLSRGEEFVIPVEATVFYAINSSETDLKFALRRKPAPVQPRFASATLSLPKSSSTRPRNTKVDSLKKWTIKSITRC